MNPQILWLINMKSENKQHLRVSQLSSWIWGTGEAVQDRNNHFWTESSTLHQAHVNCGGSKWQQQVTVWKPCEPQYPEILQILRCDVFKLHAALWRRPALWAWDQFGHKCRDEHFSRIDYPLPVTWLNRTLEVNVWRELKGACMCVFI